MRTKFEDKNVSKIVLSNETRCPHIHLIRYVDKKKKVDGYYLSTSDFGIVFTNLKGKTQFVMTGDTFVVDIYPLEEAMERARTILSYFAGPLPKEDVTEWLEWIIEDEDNEDDVKAYKEFAQLIIDGKQAEALEFIEHQDTFVRDGVSHRIWQELETPTILSAQAEYERGVAGLNEASERVSKMSVTERAELTARAMEDRNK